MYPKVIAITATCGRMTCLKRLLACFLEQDYEGDHTLLIWNNSSVPYILHLPDGIPSNKHVKLVNSPKNSITNKNYLTLGEIYNDILLCVNDYDVITHMDDDDIFLPNHISAGVLGFNAAVTLGWEGYKPQFSYYRSTEGITPASNVLEPSMFIKLSSLKEFGYADNTSDQHLQWVNGIKGRDGLLVLEHGPKTLIYNWGDGKVIPTFKTSGDPKNPGNFQNYRYYSQDHGNRIVSPISKEEIQDYYKEINQKTT